MAAKLSWWLLSAFWLLACGKPDDISVDSIPNPRKTHAGWVTDTANALGAERSEIEQVLEALKQETQAQVALVVVPTIGDADPKEFAVALFKHWSIGRSEHDDGALVLHVLDVRRVEVETGYGLEGVLPDVKVNWLRDKVVSKFRENLFGAGHLGLVRGIAYGVRNPQATRSALLQAAQGVENPVEGDDDPQLALATRDSGPSGAGQRIPDAVSLAQMASGVGPWFGTAWLIALVGYFARTGTHKHLYRNPKRRPDGLFGTVLFAIGTCATVFFFAAWATELVWVAWFGVVALGSLGMHSLFTSVQDFREARRRYTPRVCAPCKLPMQLVADNKDERHLSSGQAAEERLRSADYFVWRCACGNSVLERYEDIGESALCEGCGFYADVRKKRKVVTAATLKAKGLAEVHYRCAHCKVQRVMQEVIPKVEPAGSSSGGGSSRGGSSRGSSSSSSFGGGRSGGGGAGWNY